MYNTVELIGTIASEPVFVYRNKIRSYYTLQLAVNRLSPACDMLPVYLHEEHLLPFVERKQRVKVEGALRTYSQYEVDKKRLIVYVQAFRISPTDLPDANRICLQGSVAKLPILRRTPFGREICDILLLVRRNASKCDMVPVIVWNALAQRAANLRAGDPLCIEGRFQSREYEKRMPDGACELRVAYEVSCSLIHNL